MTKPKKKPKTGDVVGWVVLNDRGVICDYYMNREHARRGKARWAKNEGSAYYIGRISLSK